MNFNSVVKHEFFHPFLKQFFVQNIFNIFTTCTHKQNNYKNGKSKNTVFYIIIFFVSDADFDVEIPIQDEIRYF